MEDLDNHLQEFELLRRSNAKVILKLNKIDKLCDYFQRQDESISIEMELLRTNNARISSRLCELESKFRAQVNTEIPEVNKRIDCYRFFIFMLILFQIGLFAILLILKI
jgi:hypothetical protein